MYAQTVEVPADRRITLEVPKEIPAGSTARFKVIWETPQEDMKERVREMWDSLPTLEEVKRKAEEQYAAWKDTGIDPLEKFRGSKIFGDDADGLTYQRKMRDEWRLGEAKNIY